MNYVPLGVCLMPNLRMPAFLCAIKPGPLLSASAFSLFLSACNLIPTATMRDARTLAPGKSEISVGVTAAGGEYSPDIPSTHDVGSLTVDELTYRRGVTTGVDELFRIGSSAVLFVPIPILGVFGGYERGWTFIKHPQSSSVTYCGGLLGGGFDFIVVYSQVYCGLIVGRTTGMFRPELNLKGLAQAGFGLDSEFSQPFGLFMAEPRLRISKNNTSIWGGLGIGQIVGAERLEDNRGEMGIKRTVVSINGGLSW